jgi:pyruvate/2-oxoglutarate dehydrogenase complex dihydrolipoamide acyltransferase (E2) component
LLTNRLFSASAVAGSFDSKFNEEAKTRKISPAAGIYLRGFGVLPSMITATGPKGHITKQDVTLYIETNKLQRRLIGTAPPVFAEKPKT